MMYLIGIGAQLPLIFTRGMDCILSRLRLLTPSSSTDYRSVSDGKPWTSKSSLGFNHADRPIFNIITIPKFYSWPCADFSYTLCS